MRFSGKLHTWNDERGFGFIRPDAGGQDIFVHVSMLPSPRPRPEEVLTFEIALNAQGKKKAVQVRRQAVESAGLQADRSREAMRHRASATYHRPVSETALGLVIRLIGMVLLVGLGWFGWQHFESRGAWRTFGPAPAAVVPAKASPLPAPESRFRCDGRQHCSQMSSCEEATFFLKNCPTVKMDGDNDGIPCEQQLCGR